MRLGIVVTGLVILVIGAVLMFVPLVPQASQTTTGSAPFAVLSVSGFSITGSIPVAISWSAPTTVIVAAAACSHCSSNVSTVSGVILQTGTSGSFTLDQPNGGEIAFAAVNSTGGPSPTVTYKITTALSTVGSVLLIVGIIVLIIGVVLKSKKAKMAAAAATSAPMSTMPSTTDSYTYPSSGPESPGSPPMGPS